MNKIIAIVGMSGSGKNIAVEYFEKKGFTKIYFGGLIYDLMNKEGIAITPDSQKVFRENLRKEHGMGVVANLLLPDIEEAITKGDVIIDGIYSWDEFVILSEKYKDILKLICILCDKELRYERVGKRKERAFNRKDIVIRDIAEIENSAKGGPIAYADYYILNNGTIEEYIERLDEISKDIERQVK